MKSTFLFISFLLALVSQAQEIEKLKKQDAQNITSTYPYEKKETIQGTSYYLRVLKGGNWGVINKDGKRITPIKYEYINSFSNGLISVALNGKYGFIDTLEKKLLP